MTSDGISKEDWDVVQDYAMQIANAGLASNDKTPERIVQKLLDYLDSLETKYGKLPSILATRADYISDIKLRVRLLEEAYELSKDSNDKGNLMLIASSLSQLFVEKLEDASSGEKWLVLFADALGEKWDDFEYLELQELAAKVEKLKLRGQ